MTATAHGSRGVFQRLSDLHPRRTFSAVVRAFAEHDLLTYASAIAFNGMFAVIPLVLFGLGLLGLLGLDEVWTAHLGPDLRHSVSGPVYQVLDSSVNRVFASRRIFWATFGAALTVWEVSGAMRAAMTVLDRIYRVRRERSRVERYGVSLVLSAIVTVLVVVAVVTVELGGSAAHGIAGSGVGGTALALLRWPVGIGLLLAAVGTVVRWAPAVQREWRWVSFGSGLSVGAWIAMSLLFGFYLHQIADYGSMFGNLATVIVAFEYAYLTAIVLLAGLAVDGIAQEEDPPPGG